MKNKVLCSTGFIGHKTDEKNHALIMEYAEFINCGGFEFMMFRSWYDKLQIIAKDLRASGLKFPVFHTQKSIDYMDWSNLNALPPGDGNIDFEEFFRFLKGKNYTGYFILEAVSRRPDGGLDIEKLNRNLEYIDSKI